MKKLISTLMFMALLSALAFSQDLTNKGSVSDQTDKQEDDRRHSIGSTFFMLGNLLPESPSFYQLNYGYALNPKNVIIVEAITWKYQFPLGIPFGPSFDSPEEEYPGTIRGYGIGLAYKRFHWKNLFTTVQATPFLQKYLDEEGAKIQNGFQLFLQLRIGYRFEFFDHRFYLEPSVVCNYWPINTNIPESFASRESEWPNYFLFEPGLHFGFKF